MEIRELRNWLRDLPGKLNALLDTPEKQNRFAQIAESAYKDQAVIDWAREFYSLDFLDTLAPPDDLTEKQKEMAAFYVLNEVGLAIQNPQDAGGFWDKLNPDSSFSLFKQLGWVKSGYPFTIISRLENAIQAVRDNLESKVDWNDPAYISNSEAVILSGDKITLAHLSKILRAGNSGIRYIRKGNRSKVHSQDWRLYLKTLKGDGFEVLDVDGIAGYLAGVENRKDQERRKKMK